MAITYQDSNNNVFAFNGSGGTVALNTSCSSNDLIVVALTLYNATSNVTPTVSDNVNSGNYTVISSTINFQSGQSLWFGVFYKVANASGIPTVTVGSLTGLGSTAGGYCGIARYNGFTTTPAVDSAATSFKSATSVGPATGQAVASAYNPELLLAFGYVQVGATFTGNPSGWTLDPPYYDYGNQTRSGQVIETSAPPQTPTTFSATISGSQYWAVQTVGFYNAAPTQNIVQSAASSFSLADPWPTSVSVTLSGVTAGNAILIVTPAVINTTGSPTLTITDSVNSVTDLQQLASFGLSSVYSILDFSIIPNASGGAHTLTATVGSGTGYGFIIAAEISGLSSSATLDVFSLNSAGGGSNPSTGNSGVPASVSEIAIAAVSAYESSVVTIGEPSGYTNIAKYQAGGGYVQYSVDYLTPVALSAQSASWTGLTGVNTYVAGVIVLKAASNQATVAWWS